MQRGSDSKPCHRRWSSIKIPYVDRRDKNVVNHHVEERGKWKNTKARKEKQDSDTHQSSSGLPAAPAGLIRFWAGENSCSSRPISIED
jgi:hypothetical protein